MTNRQLSHVLSAQTRITSLCPSLSVCVRARVCEHVCVYTRVRVGYVFVCQIFRFPFRVLFTTLISGSPHM